jgi:hypothetical protein
MSQPTTRGFKIVGQYLNVCVDIAACRLTGYTELTLEPESADLRRIRINCKSQIRVLGATVNGVRTKAQLYVCGSSALKVCDVASLEAVLNMRGDYAELGELSIEIPDTDELNGALVEPSAEGNDNKKKCEPLKVGISYEVIRPVCGFRFVSHDTGCLPRSRRAWSCSSRYEASTWFPCLDGIGDRCPFRIDVTCVSPLTVVSCGTLTRTPVWTDEKKTHRLHSYRIEHSVSACDIFIAVGSYETKATLDATCYWSSLPPPPPPSRQLKSMTDNVCLMPSSSTTTAKVSEAQIKHSISCVPTIIETYQTYLGCRYPFERHQIVFMDDDDGDGDVGGSLFAARTDDCIGVTRGGNGDDLVYAGISVYERAFACGPEMIDQTYLVWRQLAYDIAMSWVRIMLPIEMHADVWIVHGLAHHLTAQYCTKAFGRNETDYWRSLDVSHVLEHDAIKTIVSVESLPPTSFSLATSVSSDTPSMLSAHSSGARPELASSSVVTRAVLSPTQALTLKQLEGRRRRAERRAVIAAAAAPRQGSETCICDGGNSRPLYWTGYAQVAELHDAYAIKKAGVVMKMLEQTIGAPTMCVFIQNLLQPISTPDVTTTTPDRTTFSAPTSISTTKNATSISPPPPKEVPSHAALAKLFDDETKDAVVSKHAVVSRHATTLVTKNKSSKEYETKKDVMRESETFEVAQTTRIKRVDQTIRMDAETETTLKSASTAGNYSNGNGSGSGNCSDETRVLSTSRFFKLVGKVSGMTELANTVRNTFADQWVYCNGHPRIYCAFHFNRKTYTANVTLTQEACRCENGDTTDAISRRRDETPTPMSTHVRAISGETNDRGVRFAGDMTLRIHQVLNSMSLEHHRRFEDDELKLEFGILSRSRRTRKLHPNDVGGGGVSGAAKSGSKVGKVVAAVARRPIPTTTTMVASAADDFNSGTRSVASTRSVHTASTRVPLAHMSSAEALLANGDSPVLWIRADPLHTWLRPVTVEQDEAMWLQQLRNDRDASAQLEALRTLKKLGAWRLPVTTTELLTDIFGDEQLFHAVRVAAADALLAAPYKHAGLDTDKVAEHVLARYRERWFHTSEELRLYPTPHDFSDIADYRTKIGTLQALAHMRDPQRDGCTPLCIVTFFRHILHYHDNTSNTHSDVFYLQKLLRAFGHFAFVSRSDSTATDDDDVQDLQKRSDLRNEPGEEILWSPDATATTVVGGRTTHKRPPAETDNDVDSEGELKGHKRNKTLGKGFHQLLESSDVVKMTSSISTSTATSGCGDGIVGDSNKDGKIAIGNLDEVYVELLRHLEYDAVMPSHQRRITCAVLQAFAELEMRHAIRPHGMQYTEYVKRRQPGNVRVTAFECMLSLLCMRLEFLETLVTCMERECVNAVGIDMAVRWAESFENHHTTASRTDNTLLMHCASSARSALDMRTRLWRLVVSVDTDTRFRSALLRVLNTCLPSPPPPSLTPVLPTSLFASNVSLLPLRDRARMLQDTSLDTSLGTSATNIRKRSARTELSRRRACRHLECIQPIVSTRTTPVTTHRLSTIASKPTSLSKPKSLSRQMRR